MNIRDELEKVFSTNSVLDYELLDFSKSYIANNRKDIPRLFRFSNADYYNIRALETQTLFLSPIGSMNDVFEGLSCEIDDKIIDNIDKMSDIAYLKSFSEEKDNLLMWAHYANNYSGMCVEYDFSSLSSQLIYHLFPIIYTNRRMPNNHLDYVIQELGLLKKDNAEYNVQSPDDYFFLNDIMYLFLNKNKAWSYEKEWRIVVTYPQLFNTSEELNDSDNDLFYKIVNQKINVKDCIKAVYLGPKMKKEIKDHIKEICNDKLNEVSLFSSKLSTTEYKLEYTKI